MHGVGEGAVTVVKGIICAGADDVAVTGVIGWTLDGVPGDPGTGTFRVGGSGVNPHYLTVCVTNRLPELAM